MALRLKPLVRCPLSPFSIFHYYLMRSLIYIYIVTLIWVAGCATSLQSKMPTVPTPLRPPVPSEVTYTKPETPILSEQKPQIRFKPTPQSPILAEGPAPAPSESLPITFKNEAPIQVNLEGIPVPAFINEVFGNLLGLSFEIDTSIQSKRELVTLRVSEPQPPAQLYKLAQQILMNYSVELQKQGELMRFAAMDPSRTPPPTLIFEGSTLPEVPSSHRSIVQFITLKIVSTPLIRNWLQQAFQGQPLNILDDYNRNAIILVGPPQLVSQAAETIKLLDRPAMRGRYSIRIEPAFLSPETLSQRLIEILSSQGYQIGGAQGGSSTIMLPIPEIRSLLVFAAEPQVLELVQQWAELLDKPTQTPTKRPNLFIYPVKNTAAQPLAQVINGLQQSSSQLSVDAPRNAILFLGNNEDWVRILPILQDLDRPSKQVLIEATVAEITLSEKDEQGIEWILTNAGLGGLSGKLGTLGTLGAGSAGLTYTLSSAKEVRAVLNAFVSNSRATILSTPRLMVRSGSQASITVGNEIPILTSQATSNQQSNGNSAILQQIQYRRTGITLNIQPTVYAGRRVDLTISQEVSSSQPNSTSNIDSPIILNRQVKTDLSLKDGQSILLGGLISDSRTEGQSGVPVLKDLPLIGGFFRAQKQSQDRTELVIMLIPYVIDGEEESKGITEALRRRFQFLP